MKFDKPKTKAPTESKSLVVRSRSELTVFRFTPQAITLRENALKASKAITEVKTPSDQRVAVAAQLEITEVSKVAKQTWEEAKRPIIDYRKKMDDTVKAYLKELEAESERLSRTIGDFQALEIAKRNAAVQAENKRLADLEQERAKEVAKAGSLEEVDDINQKYSDRAATEARPIAEPARVEGQAVREEWVVQVSDIWMLARAHPGCVKIEPRMAEIKALLNAGVKVAGVTATRQTFASVRAGAPIEV